MRRKKGIRMMSVAICGILLLAGCQKTPEQSAVASKAGGLSEDLIAKPLGKGATKTYELPAQWKKSEKRSSDRVTMNVELPMQSITTGNLPVVEMKNHAMTQKELEKLVAYFADGQELYMPREKAKEAYLRQKARIDSKQGAYADPVSWTVYKDWSTYMENAAALAPEQEPEAKPAEVKFQKNSRTEAYYASHGKEVPEKDSKELFFAADIGADRTAHIKAERYDADAGNSSLFSWKEGNFTVTEEEIQSEKEGNSPFAAYVEDYGDTYKYAGQFQQLLETIEAAMQAESISVDDAQKQAEQLLLDLDVQDMSVRSSQKLLWFPEGVIENVEMVYGYDTLFQMDLEKGQTGYEVTFARTVAGISVDQFYGSVLHEEKNDTYHPPFDVETVKVVITESGIKSFEWQGLCEEVSQVAKNTVLLPFEQIETRLFDQIYYRYAEMGQPAESKTKFIYTVSDARLGYSYVPAYGEPSHAWLVPTWFFKVRKQVDDTIETGREYDDRAQEFMLNALDGGLMAYSY